jgi:hypothetical protein
VCAIWLACHPTTEGNAWSETSIASSSLHPPGLRAARSPADRQQGVLQGDHHPAAPVATDRPPCGPADGPFAAPSPTPSPPFNGRMVNPTGNNALTGGTIPYTHDYYATQEAAFQLAAQLGGTVVDLGGHISNNQPEYFINLPNGITINAGNLLGVLNNATFQENSRVMDGKIAEVLNNNAVGTTGAGVGLYTVVNGHVTFDPNGRPPVYPVYTT